MPINPEWVGAAAGFLTTIAYFPQVMKVFKTRDTRSISLGMYSMITIGIFLWFVYGLMIDKPAVIIANGIAMLLSFTVLVMKLRLG